MGAAAARGRIHRPAGRGLGDNRAALRGAVRPALAISFDGHGRGAGQLLSPADVRSGCAAAERSGGKKRTGQISGESHAGGPFIVKSSVTTYQNI